MNEYKKEQLRKLLVQYKRKIDNAKSEEELKNIILNLENELIIFKNNVL